MRNPVGTRARAPVFRTVTVAGVVAGLGLVVGLSGARADAPPYSLPVTLPAATAKSPPVDPNAPYTALVLDLIHQLEPTSTPANPVRSELANASNLLHDGPN